MNPQDCKCGPNTQRPYYMGASDDPFTEVVRNAIPGENSPSIQATVASYVEIDRQESAAGAMGKATPFGSSRAA